MTSTRREFIIASTTAVCAISIQGGPLVSLAPDAGAALSGEAVLLDGDPYTAHVDEHGLGGRTWEAAYEHARRFRGTPDARDRFVLGWEV